MTIKKIVDTSDMKSVLATALGALIGYRWKRRKFVGAVPGAVLGRSVYELTKGNKTEALEGVVAAGTSMLAARQLKKYPVMGAVGGVVAGGFAAEKLLGGK